MTGLGSWRKFESFQNERQIPPAPCDVTTYAGPGTRLAQHLGQHIRAARSAQRLTLDALSDRIGTHLNTVHKLEKGRGTIMLTHIEQLLHALGFELAVVPLGYREFVETWAGWADPALLEDAIERCHPTDEFALLRCAAARALEPDPTMAPAATEPERALV